MQPIDPQQLLHQARRALALAYSPYSSNRVGAALLTTSGRIWLGANIGNASSTLNCCAEQSCIVQAVMKGETRLAAIAIVQLIDEECFPCGRCLQLLSEFADDMAIITESRSGIQVRNLSQMLPYPYRRPASAV